MTYTERTYSQGEVEAIVEQERGSTLIALGMAAISGAIVTALIVMFVLR